MEVRCKENVLAYGSVLQASFLSSHLNTAVLETMASVNKCKFPARVSLHTTPEDTVGFPLCDGMQSLSVDQHKNVITMKIIRSEGLKPGENVYFQSYRSLLLLLWHLQICMRLSNKPNALNNALFIVQRYLGVVGLYWGRFCTKTK